MRLSTVALAALLAGLLSVGCFSPAAEGTDAGPGDTGPSTTACDLVSGTCTSVSNCAPTAGHLSATSCSDFPSVCCLPLSACPSPEPICCSGSGLFRPNCANGQFTCITGQLCDAGM
jgi:hypothetical protein